MLLYQELEYSVSRGLLPPEVLPALGDYVYNYMEFGILAGDTVRYEPPYTEFIRWTGRCTESSRNPLLDRERIYEVSFPPINGMIFEPTQINLLFMEPEANTQRQYSFAIAGLQTAPRTPIPAARLIREISLDLEKPLTIDMVIADSEQFELAQSITSGTLGLFVPVPKSACPA